MVMNMGVLFFVARVLVIPTGSSSPLCMSLCSSTLLCEAITGLIFPLESSSEYLSIPDKH